MRPLDTLRHLSATLLLAGSLVACGGDPSPERVGDAAGSTAPGAGEPVLVRSRLVTATDAGEAPAGTAVRLVDDEALAGFTADLTEDFAADVVAAAAALEAEGLEDDQELAVQVVAIGCDEPTGVEVRRTADGVVLTPGPVPSPGRQCFTPMTTVAVVVLEAGAFSAG